MLALGARHRLASVWYEVSTTLPWLPPICHAVVQLLCMLS